MKVDTREVEERMAHFESVCRRQEIKLTHQRIEVFREIAQTGDHPDAEQVFKRVRERLPTVSLDTVYRTLWLLNDLGLVTTLGSSRGLTPILKAITILSAQSAVLPVIFTAPNLITYNCLNRWTPSVRLKRPMWKCGASAGSVSTNNTHYPP